MASPPANGNVKGLKIWISSPDFPTLVSVAVLMIAESSPSRRTRLPEGQWEISVLNRPWGIETEVIVAIVQSSESSGM